MIEPQVTCFGCRHFQRFAPESAIGTCAIHQVEVLERWMRYCCDRDSIEKYMRGRKKK